MTDKPVFNWIRYTELESIFMETVPCKFCGTELAPDHPAVVAQVIESSVNWEKFEGDNSPWGYPVGSVISIAGLPLNLKLLDKKLKPTLDEMEEGYYEGGSSYPQGTTFTVYVVLQYGEIYFKKTGNADSYGEVVWDGILKETKPKQIVVNTWE